MLASALFHVASGVGRLTDGGFCRSPQKVVRTPLDEKDGGSCPPASKKLSEAQVTSSTPVETG
jgi:hypothetical protein